METKMLTVMTMVLFIISANVHGVLSDATDCSDACTTACVNRDLRLEARCMRKCGIRCSPGAEAYGHFK